VSTRGLPNPAFIIYPRSVFMDFSESALGSRPCEALRTGLELLRVAMPTSAVEKIRK
jgi:hypothetical protein